MQEICLGRFLKRVDKYKGKEYTKYFIYVPSGFAKQPSFPIAPGEKVIIILLRNSLGLLLMPTNACCGDPR